MTLEEFARRFDIPLSTSIEDGLDMAAKRLDEIVARVERLDSALDEIHSHFDDQNFPHGQIRLSCEEVIVNYAGAVREGYEKSLAEYAEERYAK